MIAGGLSGYAVGKSDCDDIVLHALSDVRRECCGSDVFHSLAVPVFQSLKDLLSVFGSDIIRIFASGSEFVDIGNVPGAGLEFRIEVSSSVSVGSCTYNQFVLHDQSRHVFHDVVADLCSEDGNCISCKLLVCFRCQNDTLCCDSRSGIPELFSHSGKSFVQINVFHFFLR